MPGPRICVVMLLLGIATACSGAQQGYYDACAEPAGLALGCDAPDDDELTSWDACMKLARCGVIDMQDEDDDDPNTPAIFDSCIAEIEKTYSDLGDTVIACIDETQCPDLVAVDPTMHPMDEPNPADGRIEGIIGFCGRLDPE
jgi:hypothetical protein